MSTEQNKDIVRRWIEEGWNKGNLAVMDQLFAPNFTQHDSSPEPATSREAQKQHVNAYRSAFPDLRYTIDDLIAEGDKVVWRFRSTGTHQGFFNGMPPTGKRTDVPGVIIFRLENSRIVEAWVYVDGLLLMKQLGVTPEPAR